MIIDKNIKILYGYYIHYIHKELSTINVNRNEKINPLYLYLWWYENIAIFIVIDS